MSQNRSGDSLSNLPVNLLAGGSDGLLIAFLLSAGLREFGMDSQQILWVSLGYGLWGGLAMSWAGYIAARGEAHHYEETPNPLYEELDLDADLVERMRQDEEEDRLQWRQYQKELNLPGERPSRGQAWKQGIQMGAAYFLSLFFLISPYFFGPVDKAYLWSLGFGLTMVAALGYWRGVYTGRSPVGEMVRMLVLALAGLVLIRGLSWVLS